jgi:hypothetical protein
MRTHCSAEVRLIRVPKSLNWSCFVQPSNHIDVWVGYYCQLKHLRNWLSSLIFQYAASYKYFLHAPTSSYLDITYLGKHIFMDISMKFHAQAPRANELRLALVEGVDRCLPHFPLSYTCILH